LSPIEEYIRLPPKDIRGNKLKNMTSVSYAHDIRHLSVTGTGYPFNNLISYGR